jgi:hypothetical protein
MQIYGSLDKNRVAGLNLKINGGIRPLRQPVDGQGRSGAGSTQTRLFLICEIGVPSSGYYGLGNRHSV